MTSERIQRLRARLLEPLKRISQKRRVGDVQILEGGSQPFKVFRTRRVSAAASNPLAGVPAYAAGTSGPIANTATSARRRRSTTRASRMGRMSAR